jgi:hypothetical protein
VTIGGEKVFALQFLQARNPDWVRKPFYAKFDPEATWLDDLVPAFGEKKFFFEEDQDTPRKTIHISKKQDKVMPIAGGSNFHLTASSTHAITEM